MSVHTVDFPLRYTDTDMTGHINNAVYSVMYMTGRGTFLREANLWAPGGKFVPVIVRMEIDYIRELNFPGTVRIETAIRKLGGKSIHVGQRIVNNGELASRAVGVMVMFDTVNRVSTEIPPDWRAKLEGYLAPDFA